jgi:hypothetical protein
VFWNVLRRNWIAIICLHLVQSAASQFIGYATDYLRVIGKEDLVYISSIALFEMTFTMLWSAVWIMLISQAAEAELEQRKRQSFGTSFMRYFNQIVIESVRSLASVIWHAPLLFVPALTQYVRLTFVPLIVIFDPDYERGTVDALNKSRRLSRGHFWLTATTVVLSIAIPWYVEQTIEGGNGEWIWQNPIGVSFAVALTLLINTFTSVFLFALFRGIFFAVSTFPSDGSFHERSSIDATFESPPSVHK